MKSREILIYLAIIHRGDWDRIYNAVSAKDYIDEKEAMKVINSIKCSCITVLDENYPAGLREMAKAPFVLFYYGDISLINDSNNKLAVVGSRKCSEYGAKTTKDFVSELCKDFVIVSGLAYGIDTIAHRTAMENGGKTIAVLGNGIDICYIEDNKDIYEECKKNHLVISEYPSDVPPCPIYFPIRNRIIAGICQTLLVTEGKIASGTQITAMLMAQKSGDVCCVPDKIGTNSICNRLISEGAYLVETPEDVYDAARVVRKKAVFEM